MFDIKITHLKIITTIVVVAWLARTGEACFPSRYWISCLIDTCKLGGKCPGDPTAECKMEKSKCNGCKPTWYTKTGEKANCSVNQNLKLCPGGEPVVHCKVDSCKWPCSHPDFKGAACRQSYCGECKAEYFLKDAWVHCPVSTTGSAGEMLPIDTVLSDSCLKVPCSIDICINKRCPMVPRAVCRPDGCNGCKPAWFLDNLPVDCTTGEFITNKPGFEPLVPQSKALPPWQRECAKDVPLVPCDMKVCEKKICRNFPDAQCRPDGCGECKDTWYVDNKLVDCLSDECPPKVPIVKCVDDPCKYFGHYCPAAECRASQCGKCEAKFFANGQEIDCAMPPKECPAGVQPRNCPWYTCPANICPSDRRLMCRIDPCGSRCKYEFIDIYNGEPLLCRVFDGDGRRRDNRKTNTKTNIDTAPAQTPLLADLVPSGTSTVDSSRNKGSGRSKGNLIGGANTRPVGGRLDGNKRFAVQPILVNSGPQVSNPDLMTLLESFPYEFVNIPSAMIQTALKRNTGTQSNQQTFASLDTVPVMPRKADPSIPVFGVNSPVVKPETVRSHVIEQPIKTAFGDVNQNVIDNQLLDLAPKNNPLYPESLPVSGVDVPQNTDLQVQQDTVFDQSLIRAKDSPLYPELSSGTGVATHQDAVQQESFLNQPQIDAKPPLQETPKDPSLYPESHSVEVPMQQDESLLIQGPSLNRSPIPAKKPLDKASSVLPESFSGVGVAMRPNAGLPLQQDHFLNQSPVQAKPESKPIYPELTNIPVVGTIPAGKPSNMNSNILGKRRRNDNVKPNKSKSTKEKVQKPKQRPNGLPISIGMFSQWADG